MSEQQKADSLSDFTIRFRALDDDPRPPAIRVRLMLKYALRACRLRNEGFIDDGPAEVEEGQEG